MTAPCIYEATVGHRRTARPPLAFVRRMYLWLVDLDDLPRLPSPLRPFARFEARDHFAADEPGSIREKLDRWLAGRGVDLGGGRVLMLCQARMLGYTFNPITMYWCHRADGTLACVVAEVHNTYGGRHAYLLPVDAGGRARVGKEFPVSPFHGMDLEYDVHVPRPGALLTTTVRVGWPEPALTVTVHGVRRAPRGRWLLRTLLARPFEPRRVAFLIHRYGIALWLRRAPMRPVRGFSGELGG